MRTIKNSPPDPTNLNLLYNSGKSMSEIAQAMGCSLNKIVYWMNKYNISKRSRSEASYVKHNPNGDPFKIKSNFTSEDMFLYGLGIGIFWGEGTKSPKIASLRISNTDPDLIKTFIKFIKIIYGLNENRFSYSIVCFNDTEPETVRNYWANQLKISPERFGKITIIPKQGKGTYKKKSQFGVCIVQGNNSKLAKFVRSQIETIRCQLKTA